MPVRFLTLRDLDAGGVYTLTYDAENHMIDVSGAVTATFVYNGDGVRIVSTEGVTTTVYIGNYYEYAFAGENSKTVKYYYANATRVAMREDGGDPYWLLGDHLGSTSVAANFDGSLYSRQGYKPWGETRFVVGQTPTGYQFTGQYNETGLGLYFYNARFYDAALGRFVQADSFVPGMGNPQAWDRFAYVFNNPLGFIDPSGHCPTCEPRIDGLYGLEYAIDHADDIGFRPPGQVSIELQYNSAFYNPFAIENRWLFESITIPTSKPNTPEYSYDYDPLGWKIEVQYGTCRACAVIELITIASDHLGLFAPVERGSVTATLYYSQYLGGHSGIRGITICNQSDDKIAIPYLLINDTEKLIQIETILKPGESEQIPIIPEYPVTEPFSAKLKLIPIRNFIPAFIIFNSFNFNVR